MLNNDELEHYPNAPLIEALVDIQVSMPSTFSVDLLTKFADSLKVAFPVKNDLYQLNTMVQFGPEADNQSATSSQNHIGFRLSDAENKKVIQIREGGFSFSLLKPYSDWDSFSGEATKYWGEFVSTCKPEKVVRCALRYINRIDIPLQTVEIEKYLNVYPNMPDMPDDETYTVAGMQMSVLLPQGDLGDAVVNLATVDAYSPDGTSILLDIDIFKLVGLNPSSDVVWNLLKSQRDRKNKLFENFITDKTRELIR
jgi:uncharacterized protein (TIGR04255 family)